MRWSGTACGIEATTSFFLESTFIAVWAFGWNRLSAKAHAVTIWLVAIAANLSALWILIANSWMQHPVGYTIRNGRAELTDFLAVVTQKFAVLTFLHTVTAAYILAGFFVMVISAYHLLRKQHTSFFTNSFRIALTFTLVFSLFEVFEGHLPDALLNQTQPSSQPWRPSERPRRARPSTWLPSPIRRMSETRSRSAASLRF